MARDQMSISQERSVQQTLQCDHLPETLQSRWREGINFGDFGNATIQAYYKA